MFIHRIFVENYFMKLIKICLEDQTQIEIELNYLILERILINNELVSSKFSLFGRVHYFHYDGHYYKVVLTAGAFGWWLDLFKDGTAIIESAKHGCLFLICLGVTLLFLLDLVSKYMN